MRLLSKRCAPRLVAMAVRSDVRPDDLAAVVLKLWWQEALDAALIEDVILGCAIRQVKTIECARMAALLAAILYL